MPDAGGAERTVAILVAALERHALAGEPVAFAAGTLVVVGLLAGALARKAPRNPNAA